MKKSILLITLLFLFLSILTFIGCKPVAKTIFHSEALPPWDPSKGIVILHENEKIDTSKLQKIALIKVGEGGFTVKCSYLEMLNLLKVNASEIGANIIKINEYKEPDRISSCHRFLATAYHTKDSLSNYEVRIPWSEQRKLTVKDFKADTVNRPRRAATSSYNKLYFDNPSPFLKSTLRIEAVFDCRSSYFKEGYNNKYVLEHEQLHFDITELFARKLTKVLQERSNAESLKFYDYLSRKSDSLRLEKSILNDKFDSEVYPDPSQFAYWRLKIDGELKAHDHYNDKVVTFPGYQD
jgi:hypothetical protein